MRKDFKNKKEEFMKKINLALLGGIIALSSCSTAEKVMTLNDIEGEWNIVEVSGETLDTSKSETKPFIGFDIAERRVYGCSGCNRMMHRLDENAKAGTIDLENMASTMMMCPDMDTERKVLDALTKAKSYRKAGKNKVELCDANGMRVALLTKK